MRTNFYLNLFLQTDVIRLVLLLRVKEILLKIKKIKYMKHVVVI